MANATGKFTHLFVKQSALYKDFRPRYPPQLFKEVFQFALGNPNGPARQQQLGGGGSQAVAVDVATGNGQVLEGLIPAFDKIYAIDASPNQVAQATPHPNVEYKVADAHALALPDASVDLVTVGQALHWFELPAFYREVRRVLKPGGTLAAWCYDLGTINGDAGCEATKVLHDLYEAQLGSYWSDRRRLVEQGYEGSEPRVGADFGTVRKLNLAMTSELSLDGVVGYCKSWSAYQTYRSQHPDRPDPIVKFTDDFRKALLSSSSSSGGSGGETATSTAFKSSDDAADGAVLPTVQLVRKLTLMLAKDPQPVNDAQ